LGIKVRVESDEGLSEEFLDDMCGIAGYSLSPESALDRTLAAQSLLAGIAERGADAVGYAYRAPGETYPVVTKQRTPASELLDRISVPAPATQLLVHVRDYTKGHPSISANNHPVRHGPVVGIHNGIILNDDELLAPHSCARAEARMTVDSEAIFALAAHSENDSRALEDLTGSFATAWLDERVADTIFLARGAGRPLWLGTAKHELFFASTSDALEVVERYVHVRLRKREVKMGTFLALRAGRIARDERFRPDHAYRDPVTLPAVRAPQEGVSCLERLAALAAA
jgi:glucosamine 6-phosphate synthetase-like amidotransferase/phosphosugar isomerase protein